MQPPTPPTLRTMFRGIVFRLMLLAVIPCGAAAGQDSDYRDGIEVDAVVTSEMFVPGVAAPSFSSVSAVRFSRNAHDWQVRVEQLVPPEGRGTVYDCRRIPDGIRLIISAPPQPGAPAVRPDTVPAAEVYAAAIPPPEIPGALIAWLAYMHPPQFETNGTTPRRFLAVRDRTYESKDNKGRLALEWANSSKTILRAATMDNLGVAATPDGFKRLPAPFSAGFTEFAFEVRLLTNSMGADVPAACVVRLFAPHPNPSAVEATYVNWQETLVLKSIRQATALGAGSALAPQSKVIALDHRFAGVPKEASVNYAVTNDVWRSATNAELQYLAKVTAAVNRREPQGVLHNKQLLFTGVLAVLLLAPVLKYAAGRTRQAGRG